MPNPLSHTDRAASFEQGADVYAATRPPYPDEAVDWLLPTPPAPCSTWPQAPESSPPPSWPAG